MLYHRNGAVDASRSDAKPRLSASAIVAVLLSIIIFAIDTFSMLGFAVAVLYALVVMISANSLRRRGVLTVAALCMIFTAISFFSEHTLDEAGPLARAIVSIVAIIMATWLTLKNKEKTEELVGQAALLDLTHDAIFSRTPEGVITSWNRGAEELYGWRRWEAIGKRTSDLLGADLAGDAASAESALLAYGRWEGEVPRTRRDGEQLVIACRWSLRRDADGVASAVLETHNNVTARVKSEVELDHARMELNHVARLSALGELTASIAHELNQPLAVVTAAGEACLRWLGRDVPDLGEATSSVKRMVNAARRASDVLAGLRGLARRSDSERSAVALNEVVDDTLLLLRRELLAHRVTLTVVPDPENVSVVVDRVQLQQVLINLIVNGLQALDANGERPRKMEIIVSRTAKNPGHEAHITIRDNGPGFTPEAASKLFSAFFTTKSDGMGIGLSVSRRIIETHGGRIAASANEPVGAVFKISLPMTEEQVPETIPSCSKNI